MDGIKLILGIEGKTIQKVQVKEDITGFGYSFDAIKLTFMDGSTIENCVS